MLESLTVLHAERAGKVVQAIAGLRVSAEVEEQGLDINVHGERGYNM